MAGAQVGRMPSMPMSDGRPLAADGETALTALGAMTFIADKANYS